MKTLARITEHACEYAANLEAERYSGPDAARHAEDAARLVRAAEAIKLFFAQRAVETSGWRRVSHAASPEQWLAKISGTSETTARDSLMTASRLEVCPNTEAKLRGGALSIAQATQVTIGAVADPDAEEKLLRVAERKSMRTLREEKDRIVAAATDEQRARKLAHEERHLRTWTRGYATHGSFSGPNEEVFKLLEALEPLTEARFAAARTTEQRESHDAYRFDALVQLATHAVPAETRRPEPVVRARVDLEALLRGKTEPGEVCEIPGVGPIPVSHAREVLSHGLLELVITDGVDVQTVVSTTRHVPKPLRIAIEERDGGRCQIDGCDYTRASERHHIVAFVDGHLTTYEILVTVCPEHHSLVHHRGYTIIEHVDGSYTLRAPPHSDAA